MYKRQVQELVTDDHLTLTQNTNYWNGSPKLDKLTISTISDGDTLSAALQAGNIDRPTPVNVKPRLDIKGRTVFDEMGVKRLDDVTFTVNAGEVLGLSLIHI